MFELSGQHTYVDSVYATEALALRALSEAPDSSCYMIEKWPVSLWTDVPATSDHG